MKSSQSLTLKISNKFTNYFSSPIQTKFDLWLNPCASFYELESGESFIERRLEFQRGTQDIKLRFSGSSCLEAKLDVTDVSNFKVELFQGEQPRVQTSAFTLTGNDITIAKSLTSFIPVDEPFYIIVSTRFQS